ncbi:ATPase WRNIP1-like isoform X2 [Rhodnius prolixus]|uniref:ATPase WRNIP1-like isoform X2 n=1 Tax=Rhodnius prolixus TaxID=13249 RepID=UPI003D187F69
MKKLKYTPKNNQEKKELENTKIPLAERMRPTSLQDFVGQQHILASNTVFRNLLEQQNIPSMIMWGPPGCGKTSLAHIIHKMCQAKHKVRFIKLSATLAGVNDVKEIVKVAKNEINLSKRHTVLFMDEIHRFNKLQQDIFLPHVESGIITLIGATTENPSFSLNSALLSRCRVFVLEKLGTSDISTLLSKAVNNLNIEIVDESSDNVKSNSRPTINKDSISWLSEICDGDARIALNSLQMAVESNEGKSLHITLDDIKEGIKRSHLLYDRKGEEHYNIISALHKSIRASDDNASLYWLARMLEGGEDPLFIARRLVRAASEDVGLVDPMALTLAVSAMQGCQLIGKPECDVLLAQVAVYLARTYKSQEVYHAYGKAKECVQNHKGPLPSVPLHLRNAPTRLMRELGYAKGYNMNHKDESGLTYMPEGLENISFFQ